VSYLPRNFIASLLVSALLTPGFVEAKIGYQGEQDPSAIDTIPEPEAIAQPELSSDPLLEEEKIKWQGRIDATQGFWATFMNNRKVTSAFVEQHKIRRNKRKEKRLACRGDLRRANRDNLLSESMRCFRATLTIELEMLRKERQYVESIAGVTDQYKTAAIFHIDNLMEAISTVTSAIDNGVYNSKEDLLEAKKSLESHYRLSKRTALAKLRVDRSRTWMKHLMVRLHSVLILGGPEEEVVPKIEEAIACLEQKEALIFPLFSLEDYSALDSQFRQVQSEIKFCTEMARKAFMLNKELEQAHDEL
jgi:hypothetical protein